MWQVEAESSGRSCRDYQNLDHDGRFDYSYGNSGDYGEDEYDHSACVEDVDEADLKNNEEEHVEKGAKAGKEELDDDSVIQGGPFLNCVVSIWTLPVREGGGGVKACQDGLGHLFFYES